MTRRRRGRIHKSRVTKKALVAHPRWSSAEETALVFKGKGGEAALIGSRTIRSCLAALVPFRCPTQMTISKWRKANFYKRNGRPTEWGHRSQTGP